MTKYKKLVVNPLGLVTCTIRTDEFNDYEYKGKKLSNSDRKMIQRCLRGKMIEVVESDDNDVTESNDNDVTESDDNDVIAGLREGNKQLAEQVDAKDKEIYDLKLQLVDGYADMDAKELAKEFTIPELEFICGHEKIQYKSGTKEATLTKKIVEARG